MNARTRTYTFYTRLILNLMRALVNSWFPLTHASHCMTTSRPGGRGILKKILSLYYSIVYYYKGMSSSYRSVNCIRL